MILESRDLVVLTSPPASGKTYWISSLVEALPEELILVISPLRALADECRQRWKDRVLVMTPEEWSSKRVFQKVVIFDEFHLFFYWGDSFRPLMWEVFYEICDFSCTVILLTATLSKEMLTTVKDYSTHFDQLILADFGNQQLKFPPRRYIVAPSSNWLLREIEGSPQGTNVKLIFCRYRKEVLQLEERLTRRGYSCVSCIGGESKYMKEKLARIPAPDFIISTTVLSHGVNLPAIWKVFFLYKVENIDFWIQMVARGGRKGESYEVFALEKPFLLPWNRTKNFLIVAFLTLKQNLSLRSFSL